MHIEQAIYAAFEQDNAYYNKRHLVIFPQGDMEISVSSFVKSTIDGLLANQEDKITIDFVMQAMNNIGVENYCSNYANKYNGTMYSISDTNIESKLINKINGLTKKSYKTGFSSSFNSTPITIDWLKAYNGETTDLY